MFTNVAVMVLIDGLGQLLVMKHPKYPFWMLPGHKTLAGETVQDSLHRTMCTIGATFDQTSLVGQVQGVGWGRHSRVEMSLHQPRRFTLRQPLNLHAELIHPESVPRLAFTEVELEGLNLLRCNGIWSGQVQAVA